MIQAGIPEAVATSNAQAFGPIAERDAAWLSKDVKSIASTAPRKVIAPPARNGSPVRQGVTVNGFDVSVYAIRRRAGRRKPFEVRWRAAGRSRSKSFITRRLADSYRAELVRAPGWAWSSIR